MQHDIDGPELSAVASSLDNSVLMEGIPDEHDHCGVAAPRAMNAIGQQGRRAGEASALCLRQKKGPDVEHWHAKFFGHTSSNGGVSRRFCIHGRTSRQLDRRGAERPVPTKYCWTSMSAAAVPSEAEEQA